VFLYFANGAKLRQFPVVHEIVISNMGIKLNQHWTDTDCICCGKVYVPYIQVGTQSASVSLTWCFL